MRILGTFASRDIADSIKEDLVQHGFAAADLIIMTNRTGKQDAPPEDAKIEGGSEGPGGLAGVEERIGKVVLNAMGKPSHLEGDGSEGDGKEGALLSILVSDPVQAERARELLERHNAGDIETVDD